MSKEELQVNFRMPASLKGELEALARQNRRSLTAEVVARLERSVSELDEVAAFDQIGLQNEAGESSVPKREGSSKTPHCASTDEDGPVTRRDLNAAMMEAMKEALDILRPTSTGSPSPTRDSKPQKNLSTK